MERAVPELINFIRLQYLLNNTAPTVLRQQFREEWNILVGFQWDNTTENGAKFIQGIGKGIYQDASKAKRKVMESGDITKWDLTILAGTLKCFDKKGKSAFEPLLQIRNQLSHEANMVIEADEFDRMWKSVSVILLAHGLTQEALDEAKKIGLEEQKAKEENPLRLNKANMATAQELKSNANELFKKNQYDPAIVMYSEAIILTGISSSMLAVLYSNRSAAFMQSGDYVSAKDDAKAMIRHEPCWWKSYCRLASSYKALEKYEKALKCFNISLALEPSNADVMNERDHCRHQIAKLKRDEHLDPMFFDRTFDDVAQWMKKDFGIQRHGKQLEMSQKMSSQLGLALGICGDGHNYRFGRGVKQDYSIAAKYYAKAASHGNAEGLYNLAQLTKEGLGVPRNIPEAIRLLRQAASQEFTQKVSGVPTLNIGVMEAEHELGRSYEEGVGVPLDYKMALEWYEKSIRHGSGCSANNAGCMYDEGLGVLPSCAMAVAYWKLGAALKTVLCMENLARRYLAMMDKEEARKWYTFALQNGSVRLKLQQNTFGVLADITGVSAVEKETFEFQLLAEVRSGPLRHLVSEETAASLTERGWRFRNEVNRNLGKATARAVYGLSDPYRIHIISKHRQSIDLMRRQGKKKTLDYYPNPVPLSPVPVDLIGLKPISFQDMRLEEDHIYEGFALKLTLIEDADLGRPSIALIGEDEKGDAQRIFVYNFKQDQKTQDVLGYGCQITIVNPYYRAMMYDELPGIRIDDISMLILHSSLADKKRCRFCGKLHATAPCRKCKRVFYCSKLCLKQDLSQLGHELVCIKRL